MPIPGKNALGVARNFMSVVKEIDFEEVRERAESSPRFVVIAPQEEEAREAALAIFGSTNDRDIEIRAANRELAFEKSRFDGVIVADAGRTKLLEDVRRYVGSSGAVKVFSYDVNSSATDPAEHLRLQITSQLPDLAPALGRFYERFRTAAVKAIVDESAKANAQFALISNVPAVIPILGGFVSAGADLIVLTKNQIMMCYKIAAAHDRDLADQVGVIRELVPVVGAGFLWRTLAREAASFIPFAAGTIPKVVVAYGGTFSVGRAADFYYRFGKKPSAQQAKEFSRQAMEIARQLPFVRNAGHDEAIDVGPNSPTVPLAPGDDVASEK